jgi:glucans biosynthesis protein
MTLKRRHLAMAAGAAMVLPMRHASRAQGGAAPVPVPFDPQSVAAIARERAGRPHRSLRASLPRSLDSMDYDAYRGIRFKADQALWANAGLGFQVQPHHLGFLFKDRVDLFEVTDGYAAPLRYDPAQFTFDNGAPPAEMGDIGFAGFASPIR